MTLDVARWRASLQGEVDGSAVYRAMAASEPDPSLATVYQRLAETEQHHGALWEEKLRQARDQRAYDDQAEAGTTRRATGGNALRAAVLASREELSIDPGELGGSAYVAAATSFTMFAIGALIPIVLTGTAAIVASASLGAAALFGVGALVTVITGRSTLRAGLRQLDIGMAAAAITFAVGRLVGVALG